MQVCTDLTGDPVVKHIESLGGVSGHSRAINCVRFSPSGQSCPGSWVAYQGFADCTRCQAKLLSALQGSSWPQLATVARSCCGGRQIWATAPAPQAGGRLACSGALRLVCGAPSCGQGAPCACMHLHGGSETFVVPQAQVSGRLPCHPDVPGLYHAALSKAQHLDLSGLSWPSYLYLTLLEMQQTFAGAALFVPTISM